MVLIESGEVFRLSEHRGDGQLASSIAHGAGQPSYILRLSPSALSALKTTAKQDDGPCSLNLKEQTLSIGVSTFSLAISPLQATGQTTRSRSEIYHVLPDRAQMVYSGEASARLTVTGTVGAAAGMLAAGGAVAKAETTAPREALDTGAGFGQSKVDKSDGARHRSDADDARTEKRERKMESGAYKGAPTSKALKTGDSTGVTPPRDAQTSKDSLAAPNPSRRPASNRTPDPTPDVLSEDYRQRFVNLCAEQARAYQEAQSLIARYESSKAAVPSLPEIDRYLSLRSRASEMKARIWNASRGNDEQLV